MKTLVAILLMLGIAVQTHSQEVRIGSRLFRKICDGKTCQLEPIESSQSDFFASDDSAVVEPMNCENGTCQPIRNTVSAAANVVSNVAEAVLPPYPQLAERRSVPVNTQAVAVVPAQPAVVTVGASTVTRRVVQYRPVRSVLESRPVRNTVQRVVHRVRCR